MRVTHLLRIASQVIPPDSGEVYRRAVAAARAALERAAAATVSPDAHRSWARERALLAAANAACRPAFETTLQATAAATRIRYGWRASCTSGITKARSYITVCVARLRSGARRIGKWASGTGRPLSHWSWRRA